MSVQEKTNKKLWSSIVSRVKRMAKYGKPNTWNARKAQYAVKLYKDSGGKYKGKKDSKNSLVKWTKQKWDYSSESQNVKGRYLPKKVWEKLSSSEKSATNKKKRESVKKGKKKARYSKKIVALVNKAR